MVSLTFLSGATLRADDDKPGEREQVSIAEYHQELLRIDNLTDILTRDRQRMRRDYLNGVKVEFVLKVQDIIEDQDGKPGYQLLGRHGEPLSQEPYSHIAAYRFPDALRQKLENLAPERWDRFVFASIPDEHGRLELEAADFVEFVRNPGVEWPDYKKRRGGFKRLLSDAVKAQKGGELSEFVTEFVDNAGARLQTAECVEIEARYHANEYGSNVTILDKELVEHWAGQTDTWVEIIDPQAKADLDDNDKVVLAGYPRSAWGSGDVVRLDIELLLWRKK